LDRLFQEVKADHAIDPYAIILIRQGALPRTPSGKVRRSETRAAFLSGALEILAELRPAASAATERKYAPAKTIEEEVLSRIWAEAVNVEKVGVTENFFLLGGHSLIATRVVARVREVCGVEVPLRALFEAPTVRALGERVEEIGRAGTGVVLPPLVRVARGGSLPLSYAQERLWFLERLGLVGPAYNIPAGLIVEGDGGG